MEPPEESKEGNRDNIITVRLSDFEAARLDVICELYGDASRSWVLRQGLVVVAALVDAGESIRPGE